MTSASPQSDRGSSSAQRPACRWVAALLVLAGGSAQATDFPGPVRWDGFVAVANDSVHRGVSWSNGRAAASAEVSATTDQGWNASLGVESPSYPRYGGRAGFTLAAARAWQFDAGWSGQAALTRYAFAGPPALRAAGYTELMLTAGWQGRAFLNLALSPDRRSLGDASGSARGGRLAAADFGVTERLAGRLSLDAGIGYTEATVAGGRRGYGYGSVVLRWGVGPVQAQLGWVDSQAERRGLALPGTAGSRFLAQVACPF